MNDRIKATLRDPQRLAARVILAAMFGLIVFMVAAGPLGGPLSGVAVSQTATPTSSPTSSPTGSPTSSPTSSPTDSPSPQPSPTDTGPGIAFLNPSVASSDNGQPTPPASANPEISGKADGRDSAYHFVVTVRDVPGNAVVELKYQTAAREVTIGQATRVGSTNSFELFWPAADMPADASYVFKAILFSGTTEVTRVERSFRVNNAGSGPPDTSEPQGQTVEMIYPTSGGPMGFFTNNAATPATSGIVDVSFSEGTEFVGVYYTISAPGTVPVWIECGNESVTNAANGVKCSLEEDNTASQVRAVAAQAEDSDSLIGEAADLDSTDAHSVSPYQQTPTSVSLSPQIQSQVLNPTSGAFPCSQIIEATVLDQVGHKVAGVDTDVHASGPSDELSFDDNDSSGNQTSSSKPPDQGTHTTESTKDCESTTSPPPFNNNSLQGDHERPIGTPDIKHIETQPAGTSDAGQFRFQLWSADTGGTQITVWADADSDDELCSAEARGNGSIGWGQTAPTPIGLPDDETTCPRPSPSPSPTASPSPSPSESPTASPTSSPSPDAKCPGHENDTRNQVVGTPGDDDLEGTPGDDIICGLGGDDDIDGLGGDDLLLGGDGNDSILGGAGNDEIDGGNGKDGIRGNDGNDLIRGGTGNDVILGNEGGDEIRGGRGEDILRGGAGNDEVRGGDHTDTVQGGGGNDLLVGNSDKDTIKGGRGSDELKGGSEDDVLRGGRGHDDLQGGKHDDILRGGRGNDSCNGNQGNDTKVACES